MIEAAFKWTDIKPKKGDRIGLELQINDADDSGARIGTLSWNDETGMGWSKPSVYGTIELADEAKDEVSNENNKPGTDEPSTGNIGNPGTNNPSTGNTGKPGTGKPAINKPSADKPATGSTNKPLANKPAAKKAAKTSDQSATAAFIVLFLAGVSMAGASRLGRSRKQS